MAGPLQTISQGVMLGCGAHGRASADHKSRSHAGLWSSASVFLKVVRTSGSVEEMQGGGRRVRLEWGAYITV
ncbi:hypothetical protein FHG87_024821 [Trinorchestia longiramus]|nr:hypothetical protein FHG87_024821 [Trinorchestia longiramus]